MTTRHCGYLVTLAQDIREDDAEAILNALRMVRGVLSVQPVEGGDMAQMIAESRRDVEWIDRLRALIAEVRP